MTRLMFVLSLAVLVSAACSPSTAAPTVAPVSTAAQQPNLKTGGLSGGYVTDHRPGWIGYLVLTQDGKKLGGYALTARPSAEGKTTASNTPVDGMVDGDAITLHVGVALIGRIEGDDLVFTSPSASG